MNPNRKQPAVIAVVLALAIAVYFAVGRTGAPSMTTGEPAADEGVAMGVASGQPTGRPSTAPLERAMVPVQPQADENTARPVGPSFWPGVTLDVLDAHTRAPLAEFHYRRKEPLPGQKQIDGAMADTEEPGRFRFRTTPGEVSIWPRGQGTLGFGQAWMDVDLVAGLQTVRLVLKPACLIRFESASTVPQHGCRTRSGTGCGTARSRGSAALVTRGDRWAARRSDSR